MIVNFELLKNLKININEFNKGGWGSAVGRFKVYPSIIKNFRYNIITIIDDRNSTAKYSLGGQTINGDGTKTIPFLDINTLDADAKSVFNEKPGQFDDIGKNIIETSINYNTKLWDEKDYDTLVELLKKQGKDELIKNIYVIQQDAFDASRCFNEVGITYLKALVSQFEIIRSFKNFDRFDDDTQINARESIFNAIEYAAKNKQFWENINGSSISTPNWSLNVDATGWLLTDDIFGQKAKISRDNAGFDEYSLVSEDSFYQIKTKNGNILNISSFVKIDDLTNGVDLGGSE